MVNWKDSSLLQFAIYIHICIYCLCPSILILSRWLHGKEGHTSEQQWPSRAISSYRSTHQKGFFSSVFLGKKYFQFLPPRQPFIQDTRFMSNILNIQYPPAKCPFKAIKGKHYFQTIFFSPVLFQFQGSRVEGNPKITDVQQNDQWLS